MRHFQCNFFDRKGMVRACCWLGVITTFVGAQHAWGRQAPVTARIEIVKDKTSSPSADASNVVVWLQPLDADGDGKSSAQGARPSPQIAQRNKAFEPHVTVVAVGTVVQFPNKDPFFHNVFSLFDGKRFDLGMYEAGSTKSIHFDHAGVSFLFCNIHPEMSALVIAVESPYFGISDRTGRVTIANVPDGRYLMHVWYERSVPESLNSRDRIVTISGALRSLETIQVIEDPHFTLAHKNLYGQDYVPPANLGYGHH
jgi:plastocyanin